MKAITKVVEVQVPGTIGPLMRETARALSELLCGVVADPAWPRDGRVPEMALRLELTAIVAEKGEVAS